MSFIPSKGSAEAGRTADARVLFARGQYAAAKAACRRILRRAPRQYDALLILGLLACRTARFAEGLNFFRAAASAKPDIAVTHRYIGDALRELGRNAEAVAAYDAALVLDATLVDAVYNRANALAALDRNADALAGYEAALAQRPADPRAKNNIAALLTRLRRPAEALAMLDRVVAVHCEDPQTYFNRGCAFEALRRPEQALESYQRAIALAPQFAPALNNAGYVLAGLLRYEAAAAVFARLLAVSPHHDYTIGAALFAAAGCCEWNDYDARLDAVIREVDAGHLAAPPFVCTVLSGSPAVQLRCAQLHVAAQGLSVPQPFWRGGRHDHDRIRVAYLSADFHTHATAQLMAGLFEQHDRTRFLIHAISFGPSVPEDPMRARLAKAFESFIDVADRNDAAVAALVRELEIDIAVDLKGFTQDARPGILAQRAAPIQVSYLGFPGTLGGAYMDYILADTCVIPPEDRQYYTEQVVYLPDCYQVNDRKRDIPHSTPPRPMVGLPERGFVFSCFNNPYKFTPTVFDVWMSILKSVPESVLWLLGNTEVTARNLRAAAAARGVSPERLVFAPRVPLNLHLARIGCADLFLDTLPCNAHTTASESLWAGVPVVTCLGSSFAGRVAASQLRAVGLPELVAGSLDEYRCIATSLALNEERLAEMHARLIAARDSSTLFDTDRFRRHLESAYASMWAWHQRGERPASFSVARAYP
jgi:protein O-GlcNAc transferase